MAFNIEDSYDARTVRTAQTTDATIYLSALPTDVTAGYLVIDAGTSKEERISFTGTAGTGTAYGDAYGYELTFMSQEAEPMRNCGTYTTNPFDNITNLTISPAY